MANLSKIKRDQMLAFLEELKSKNNDDDSIRAINEIENQLRSKKYGLVWEEHSEQVDEMLKENIPVLIADEERRLCKDPDLPWNFIIEGDNLQALYLLEKTHKGGVDCIYIDPPYNSGAKDWKYNNDYVDSNDEYRHSKWLSMIRNRLLIAKRLLNPKKSVLICTIDEKEYLRLGCLLEELFPSSNIQMISSVINHAGTGRVGDFGRTNEFIYFVMVGEAFVLPQELIEKEEEEVAWDTLRRHNPANLRPTRPSQFYPIYVNIQTKKIVKIGDAITPDVDRFSVPKIDGCETVFPVRDNGVEMMWGVVPEECRRRLSGGYIRVGNYDPSKPQQFSLQLLSSGTIRDIEEGKVEVVGHRDDGSVIAIHKENKYILPKTQWDKQSHDATHYGTTLIKKIIGPRFSYPKSLYAVHDCLSYFIADNKNAVVVDFFAGSGTTQHAVSLMNAADNGNRICIMITNNEISADEEEEFRSRGINKGDEEWENKGIAKYVTWPRMQCVINGVDINGDKLEGDYGVEIDSYIKDEKKGAYKKTKTQIYPNLQKINKSDGFNTNIKYFKCDWTPRKPEEYLLSNALLIHIKELIELHTAKEIDGIKNIILYSKSDYDNYFNNEEKYKFIENVWVNENILFNSSEMKKLKKKKYKYIPREFFSQELKEVGEYV